LAISTYSESEISGTYSSCPSSSESLYNRFGLKFLVLAIAFAFRASTTAFAFLTSDFAFVFAFAFASGATFCSSSES
jgi:hypothetical protein